MNIQCVASSSTSPLLWKWRHRKSNITNSRAFVTQKSLTFCATVPIPSEKNPWQHLNCDSGATFLKSTPSLSHASLKLMCKREQLEFVPFFGNVVCDTFAEYPTIPSNELSPSIISYFSTEVSGCRIVTTWQYDVCIFLVLDVVATPCHPCFSIPFCLDALHNHCVMRDSYIAAPSFKQQYTWILFWQNELMRIHSGKMA